MNYWTCNAEWPSSTVWIVGGGPSVAEIDPAALAGRKVIVTNSSAMTFPNAGFLVFGDSRWFHHNFAGLKAFRGRIVSCSPAVQNERCLVMRKINPPPGICEDRDALAMRYTSFQAAINLAVHLGAARLVFLGLDGKAAKDGGTHHHQPHPWPQRPDCWSLQWDCLQMTVKPLAKRGIDVVNANPGSAYPWWRKETFDECLARYA